VSLDPSVPISPMKRPHLPTEKNEMNAPTLPSDGSRGKVNQQTYPMLNSEEDRIQCCCVIDGNGSILVMTITASKRHGG
jgi:hypothetical protein